ncbi:hypothetical protein PMAYCL1PPCAC_08047, partial [Pristionchus mayeri]
MLGTHLHMSFHYQMVVLIFIVDECIASFLTVALFRNQSLIHSGKFKLNDLQLISIVVLLHLSLAANALIFAFIDLDLEDQITLLTTEFPGLEWVSGHGVVWAAYAWNRGAFLFLFSIVLQSVVIGSFAALVVSYTLKAVRRQRRIIGKRKDKRLTKRVRRVYTLVISQVSCKRLVSATILQAIAALIFLILPLLTIASCLCGFLPYYLSWTAIALLATYSFFNSSVAVFLNPKYVDHLKAVGLYLIESRAQ